MARTDNGDKLQAGEALRSASCSVIKSGSPAALHEPVAFHYLLSARSRTALLASCCAIATTSLDLAERFRLHRNRPSTRARRALLSITASLREREAWVISAAYPPLPSDSPPLTSPPAAD